ncbi:MAG: cytochrome C oxidase subunit IV family protein [Saprospiraceae bacterium]|jgi:cytochrome c oxidase subunit IV|nr:cytochrome C oxidase subunit IV family protein [Saprospiraceae bacterium]MBK6481265.1 cytochrome C oxidase subunit IV family protein [Saprospiraceae bacterium]MBK6817965.1 cytochrome C oxidase subunit IV family protein [Saprospiraceae bacterium]MBK7436661.1 cytochrome C oxidase subunit IV family protein [Saprospiraceae bacterium]MBK7609540.1 cytochrome C oxidase subunit IV family protein [Saprospiraceae bacterium]
MSGHLTYEESKLVVFKGLRLLAVITLLEVFIALIGNGHIINGFHLVKWIMYPLMISLSLYKAYFIIYEFMHMKYEVKTLAMAVLLPMTLLIWAMIAFFSEGNHWFNDRNYVRTADKIEVKESITPQGEHKEPVLEIQDVH